MSCARHSPPDQSRGIFHARDNFPLSPPQVGLEVALVAVLLVSGVALRLLVDILDDSAVVDALVRQQQRMLIHGRRVRVCVLSWFLGEDVCKRDVNYLYHPLSIWFDILDGCLRRRYISDCEGLKVGVFRC